MIRECEVYRANPNRMCLKYIMLIPLSCNTELPLEAKSGGKHTTAYIKHETCIELEVTHAGKRRPFRPNIYSISQDGKQVLTQFKLEDSCFRSTSIRRLEIIVP